MSWSVIGAGFSMGIDDLYLQIEFHDFFRNWMFFEESREDDDLCRVLFFSFGYFFFVI
jgi:hypothetical protein